MTRLRSKKKPHFTTNYEKRNKSEIGKLCSIAFIYITCSSLLFFRGTGWSGGNTRVNTREPTKITCRAWKRDERREELSFVCLLCKIFIHSQLKSKKHNRKQRKLYWSIVSSTGSKVRITLYSIINSTTGKYCSVAFI